MYGARPVATPTLDRGRWSTTIDVTLEIHMAWDSAGLFQQPVTGPAGPPAGAGYSLTEVTDAFRGGTKWWPFMSTLV